MAKKSSKPRSAYACTACGQTTPRWLGRCPGCGEWNTLVEQPDVGARRGGSASTGHAPRAVRLGEVEADHAQRLPSGIGELDRALGGGPVAGGVVLLGGDPGIGKSTLLMQGLAGLFAAGHESLYVTGEESAAQVAVRAERIGGEALQSVRVLATTDLADVEQALGTHGHPPGALVIDSIQTLRARDLESAPGSVAQVREVAARLVEVAKKRGIALFLIGHVNKEGAIAGPKVLEHLVDTVLSFEGDPAHGFRMLRAVKNRFGPAHEVGVFEMASEGLQEVPDPSTMLLAERPQRAAGSLVAPTAEGSRPLLVEVQALVARAVYGAARRIVSGLDSSRLGILLAVLDRKAGVHVLDHDVFASIAGGVRVDERALDLALAVAVVSSLRGQPVDPATAVTGEVGLAGEVRAVPRAPARIAEVRRLRFRRVMLPRANAERLRPEERSGIDLVPVATVAEALESAL